MQCGLLPIVKSGTTEINAKLQVANSLSIEVIALAMCANGKLSRPDLQVALQSAFKSVSL